MKSVKNKWVIIKGVRPRDLHVYNTTARMFLINTKYPIKVLVQHRTFSPKEWLKEVNSLRLVNSWQLAKFEWEFVNVTFKYLL